MIERLSLLPTGREGNRKQGLDGGIAASAGSLLKGDLGVVGPVLRQQSATEDRRCRNACSLRLQDGSRDPLGFAELSHP